MTPGDSTNTMFTSSNRPQVFVVHGRDHQLRDGLTQFLRNLGTEPIVLDEQASGGRTVIEKFEHFAGSSSYAVVLLTPDDIGGLSDASSPLQERARQNVLFELGFLCGTLGRGRVCLIASPDLELPSDLGGVVYIQLDNHRQWSWQLVREFLGAGLPLQGHVILNSCQHFLAPPKVGDNHGRNDLCPCGSGIKFKRCHGAHT